MKRVLLILVPAIAAWFGLAAPGASAIEMPSAAVQVYGYDGAAHPRLPDGTPAEDGIGNLYDYLPEEP